MTPSGAAPPLDRYLAARHGELHRLPTGPGSLLRTSLLGARSKARLAGVLTRLPRMVPATLEGTTTRDWLAGFDLRPDADAVVGALLRLGTYCADLDERSVRTRHSPSCSWPRPVASCTSTGAGPN